MEGGMKDEEENSGLEEMNPRMCKTCRWDSERHKLLLRQAEDRKREISQHLEAFYS